MTRIFFSLWVFIFCCTFSITPSFAATKKYDAFNVKVSGKGQPIIFIPGATCSGDEWNETVARYSGKYECHVLTLAGYAGAMPLANGPYLEVIKKQIEEYIIDQKLENVILVGHSIGGFLAMCIASEMKDHLQKILIVDAMPFFAGANNPNAVDTFSEAKAQYMYSYYSKMDDGELKNNQRMTAKFLCRDSTKWDMIATWGARSDRKTLAYSLTEMMSNDMRKKIGDIQVPVLVLAAYCKSPEYPDFTRSSVIATFADQYKACKTCTVHVADDGAKHFIMYDAPEWYFSETDGFLSKQ